MSQRDGCLRGQRLCEFIQKIATWPLSRVLKGSFGEDFDFSVENPSLFWFTDHYPFPSQEQVFWRGSPQQGFQAQGIASPSRKMPDRYSSPFDVHSQNGSGSTTSQHTSQDVPKRTVSEMPRRQRPRKPRRQSYA
jgi:hypothetical protein